MLDVQMHFYILWGGVTGVIGGTFGIIGLVMKRYIKKKECKCSVQTVGKVVEIKESYRQSRNGGGGILYYPVVEYSVDGQLVTQRPSVGTNPCRYVVGQSVEMYYNPKMPGEILLEGDRALKILSLIFRILGYVCLAIAIGGVLFIKSMT